MSWRLTINVEDKARLWTAWYSSETPIGMYQLVSLRSMRPGPVPRSRSAWINPIPMKGTRFDDVVETKVIEADPGEGDLEEIAHRTDLHHRSDREVPIDVVVTAECQGEHRAIDRSGCEAQVASEPPAVFVGLGQRRTHDRARGQDSQETGGTCPS